VVLDAVEDVEVAVVVAMGDMVVHMENDL